MSSSHISHLTSHGILYGIGIGPGDHELLTLKAVRILNMVDTIAVPKSKEDAESLALEIVRKVIDINKKEILTLAFPMKKNQEELVGAWLEAARQITEQLESGKNVAFITIGDPMFYSTFIYLFEKIKNQPRIKYGAKIKIKVIPGVSSMNAASAASSIPIAKGNERIAVIPATCQVDKIKETLREFDTTILIKVNKVMDKIAPILEELNLKGHAVFISNAGRTNENIVRDIDLIKDKKLDYFSILLVKNPFQKLSSV